MLFRSSGFAGGEAVSEVAAAEPASVRGSARHIINHGAVTVSGWPGSVFDIPRNLGDNWLHVGLFPSLASGLLCNKSKIKSVKRGFNEYLCNLITISPKIPQLVKTRLNLD